VEELVEPARLGVDDHRVAVAVGGGAALDCDVVRDRIRPWVALVCVVEVDDREGRRRVDDGDRDADGPAVPEARTEVGMKM
jgi:hypothetical protein